jgi:acetyl esterase/lipase
MPKLVPVVITLVALAASTRAASPEVRVERDVPFKTADGQELRMDIARPKGPGPHPAVLCLHGGAWRAGNRQQLSQANLVFTEASLIEQLAARGFVAASASYRLAPKARWPAQIEDAKAAVRFLRASAGKLDLDTDRVAALGISAGGHLACLLGLTEPEDGFDGEARPGESARVQAVVSIFGPTDFTLKTWSILSDETAFVPLFGVRFNEDPLLYRKASPVHYARPGAPPFLFVHGTADPIVDPAQTHRLADNLSEAGAKVKVVEVPGEGHGWLGDKARRTVRQAGDFLITTLK